ncbi:hypothetical protein CCAX7_17060 [Capsulimonas corticalis]|uniref:Uncharacterized protein n=1 Tax=Capsulimonas corticalis TaxID=2219043 RepID=A0A402D417_9BACT|nr:hypothetical protein [Capsulimonas corticalis]BDI29655.1 hypothetical protein CCAX7_17060 [Capsulimonas corticalis]
MKRKVIAIASVLILLAGIAAYHNRHPLQSAFQNAELITVEGVFPDDGHYHRIVLSRTSNPEMFDQFKHLNASYDHSAGSRLVQKCCLITAYRGMPEHTRLEAEALCQASVVTRAIYTNGNEIGVREQGGEWFFAPKPLSTFLQQQFSLSETKPDKPPVIVHSSPQWRLKQVD